MKKINKKYKFKTKKYLISKILGLITYSKKKNGCIIIFPIKNKLYRKYPKKFKNIEC